MDGGVSRRRVLAALALAPVALGGLAGCAVGADDSDGPDPLIALADAARADAALAAALVADAPELAERVDPLVAARTEHTAALDAEVARLDPARPVTAPSSTPTPGDLSLEGLRSALEASGAEAAAVALELPVERVGLVASVSACCATYAAVLT